MLNRDVSLKQEKRQRCVEQMHAQFGQRFLELLADQQIQEMMLNPNGQIWVDSQASGMVQTDIFYSYEQAYQIITTVADLQGQTIFRQQPFLETVLPVFGYRFSAIVPDVVEFPIFCIRKGSQSIYKLTDYIRQGVMTVEQQSTIHQAIRNQDSILVAGGPGTGKTTLASAILQEMLCLGCSSQRIVIIEDTKELIMPSSNCIRLQTTHHADFNKLLIAALRLRPDKICLGECRGKETLVLLKAWNTGTPGGLATIHANGAFQAITRLTDLTANTIATPVRQLIAAAIKIIISLEFNERTGRKINEIAYLAGVENGNYQLKKVA